MIFVVVGCIICNNKYFVASALFSTNVESDCRNAALSVGVSISI